MQDAYIITGYRTAVGKAGKGGFKSTRPDDLAIEVIQHILKNTPGLEPGMVDDVLVGCANPEGEQGLQIGRLIAVRALGKDVPGLAWKPSASPPPKSAQAWVTATSPAAPKA